MDAQSNVALNSFTICLSLRLAGWSSRKVIVKNKRDKPEFALQSSRKFMVATTTN